MRVDTAIVVLGFWMCLTLLGHVKELQPVILVFNLAALIAYIIMINEDSADNRKNFFYVFSSYMVCLYVMVLYKAYEQAQDYKEIQQKCEQMQKDGEFKEELITSMEQCHDRVQNIMITGFYVLIVIAALIFYHFSAVAYTHWKNFGKPPGHEEQVDEEAGANDQ